MIWCFAIIWSDSFSCMPNSYIDVCACERAQVYVWERERERKITRKKKEKKTLFINFYRFYAEEILCLFLTNFWINFELRVQIDVTFHVMFSVYLFFAISVLWLESSFQNVHWLFLAVFFFKKINQIRWFTSL